MVTSAPLTDGTLQVLKLLDVHLSDEELSSALAAASIDETSRKRVTSRRAATHCRSCTLHAPLWAVGERSCEGRSLCVLPQVDHSRFLLLVDTIFSGRWPLEHGIPLAAPAS